MAAELQVTQPGGRIHAWKREWIFSVVFDLTHAGSPTNKQKMVLNSSDRLFAELRDASFAEVGPRLGEKAKVIQTTYQGSKVAPFW